MGHKGKKVYDISKLPQEEQNKLVDCLCGGHPLLSKDARKGVYFVNCSNISCPAKASGLTKDAALEQWHATMQIHF